MLYPLLVIIFHHGNVGYVVFSIIVGALAVFSHRANIKRLLNHTENRLDFSKITQLSKKLRKK